jgi:hypothetical protein
MPRSQPLVALSLPAACEVDYGPDQQDARRAYHRMRSSGRLSRSCPSAATILFTRDLGQVITSVRSIDFGELYVNRIGLESLQGFPRRLSAKP